MSSNPYETLGVPKTVSQDDIKNAYRNLAKKFHPDLNPGNTAAEKKFKEINAANDLLSNAELRAKFDRGEIDGSGQAAYSQSQGQSQSTGRPPFYHETQKEGGRYSFSFGDGNEDLFESLFGRRQGQRASSPGEDLLYQMEVEFVDAALGREKEINLPSGKKLAVKLPPGIESGTKLRFRGQGSVGSNESLPGDLYIEVKVKPSSFFRKVENDIECELPVTLYEALLGAEIKVPTLTGPVTLKVPPGVNTNSKLRIRGKGIPGKTPQEKGDQIVVLKVMLPEKIDSELESAIRNWSQTHSYNPRSHLKYESH